MGKIKEYLLEQQEREWDEAYERWKEEGDHGAKLQLDHDRVVDTTDSSIAKEESMKVETVKAGNEILEIDAHTGEILVTGTVDDVGLIRTTKIKALRLLSKQDFALINNVWEPKRDGLIKILSSLPIGYTWKILDDKLNRSYAQVKGVLTINVGSTTRSADAMGICEVNELPKPNMHFMNARAETRALKRAIETLFGSVINYFVINYLPNQGAWQGGAR